MSSASSIETTATPTWSILYARMRELSAAGSDSGFLRLLYSASLPDHPFEEARRGRVGILRAGRDAPGGVGKPPGCRSGGQDGAPEPLVEDREQPRPRAPLGAPSS